MFLMLYSIDWPNFIVWLPLLLEILGNICIAIVCFPGCDVINFEISLIFLIKPFFYMTKYSRQNLNILKTKKAFQVKKAFFIIFKGKSFAKNYLRPYSAPLICFSLDEKRCNFYVNCFIIISFCNLSDLPIAKINREVRNKWSSHENMFHKIRSFWTCQTLTLIPVKFLLLSY